MTENEYTNEQLIDFMYDVMDWRDVVDHPMIYAVIEALKEIQQYRALEQRLQSVYGKHDGLLEIVVNGLVKYEGTPDTAIKCVLLTDDDVDRWEAYKAIGTVEGYERAIQSSIENYNLYREYKAKVEQFEAIGTVEEFKELKENQRKCEDCAGCTTWKCDCANIRAKAIEEAIEASAKVICVGCGYLDGYKCTYKGSNCGVSKPMLESVTKALEQMKGGE